jgi:hypothetical protein
MYDGLRLLITNHYFPPHLKTIVIVIILAF